MTVIENAYAKINFFLDVTGRREDGFHDINSIMHSVSLRDTLTISAEKADKCEIFLTSNVNMLPTDNNNLVYRSALAYMSKFAILAKVKIHIDKKIPIGAGLGGGSSDAAATLRALNRIFSLASEDELLALSAEIGSDVPFCLIGGSAVCTGRGEIVRRINCSSPMHFVIAIGEDRISTPEAYRRLDEMHCGFIDYCTAANEAKSSVFETQIWSCESISKLLYNIFESVTELDSIAKIKGIMIKNKAENALMSGSGPAVFGIFKNLTDAESAKILLNESGFTAFVCHTV